MMGRKTGVAGSKATSLKQGKHPEASKGTKRQQKKPAMLSNGIKKKPVKSKPGFTLYSGSSRIEGEQKTGAESSRLVTKPGNKAELKMEASTEVVSQVQLQEEKVKLSKATSFYIPTADSEDSEGGDENDCMVRTPFNKRLVSSTPDPERLKETESEDEDNIAAEVTGLFESVGTRALTVDEDSPQMIPERDVATEAQLIPQDTKELAASVVKGLAEKLKLQREAAQPIKLLQPCKASHSEKTLDSNSLPHSQANQTKSGPLWKQKHQKWKDDLSQYKKDPVGLERDGSDILNSMVPSEIATELSRQNPMTKAEWIPDSMPPEAVKRVSSKSAVDLNHSRGYAYQTSGLRMKDKTKNTKDSELRSIETSTSAISTVKENGSVPGISSTSFMQLPTSMSSFQHKQTTPGFTDNYKDYQSFKSGILQNMNNSGKVAIPLENYAAPNVPTVDSTQSLRSHPISAPTFTTQSSMATMTSTLTHTTTVSSLNSSVKVCETDTSLDAHTHVTMLPKIDKTEPPLNLAPKHRLSQDARNISKKKVNKEGHVGKYHEGIIADVAASTTSESAQESNVIIVATATCLDSTADSQDSELSKVMGSSDANKSQNQQNQNVSGKASNSIHNTSYLSEVINFLKTDGFNAKEKATKQNSESKPEDTEEDNQPKESLNMRQVVPSSSDDNLKEIMSQYLPLEHQEETEPQELVLENGNTESYLGTEGGLFQQDVNNSSSAQVDKGDSNQNYNSDDYSYNRPRRRRKSRNLYYLESMADPTLREIACRLAFKATALRDIELRDLIDDMIFHTDAALGHEDARYQSSNLFLQEENSKLKKRLHNVNRQLDAKERQEKMASTSVYSISNNEMLHMERKMMHLRQEKDRLDAQLTALLEEKSRWLITQQDLVKAISLKDHEILKLEEKHQQERIKLHQSLDQATQNSQGVHYKLSVADREISNMEQRLKCRDLDIADLREKLRLAELSVGDCKQQVTMKDQEISRLKDMVDTLKLGVDHVLKMFESGSPGLVATEQQRQGIDSLYRMAHPERFTSGSGTERREPTTSYQPYQPYVGAGATRQQEIFAPPAELGQSLGVPTQTSDNMAHLHLIRPEPRYPGHLQQALSETKKDGDSISQKAFSWMQQRLQNLTDGQRQPQVEASYERQRSQETVDGNRLTAAVLEEHNQRLSPIDRRLWRSMQESPIVAEPEPYYSDSEIELTRQESRRFSSKSPKSILKRDRGRANERYWQTSTPNREEYYQDQDRERSRRPYRNGQERNGRARRKSESDKYCDHRRSDREFPKSHEERRKRIRSTTPREHRHERSRQEGSDEERDNTRYSISDYFKKKSQMPRLPKSPRRESRERVRTRTQQSSQSSKLSTLFSVPISKSSDGFGPRIREKSTSTPISKSMTQDDELVEVDIEASSIASSELNMRRNGPSFTQGQKGKTGEAWNMARSYSPSSIKKTDKSKRNERRSRSLEDYPQEREQIFGRSVRSNSQEQETRFRTLEPDTDSSASDDSLRQRRDLSKVYFSPRRVPLPNQSGQKYGSQSHSEPSQPRASNGPSSGGTTNGIPSHYATRGSDFPNQSCPRHISDISLSRRATNGGDVTQREFFQGTELSSTSLSSIEDDNNGALTEISNNNQMRCLNEDLFSTGIASLDMKIANLQKKIDRAKAIFS